MSLASTSTDLLHENVPFHHFSFRLLVLCNDENIKCINDLFEVNGVIIKFEIFHLSLSSWYSSNPNYQSTTFQKAQAIVFLFDNDGDRVKEMGFIATLWCKQLRQQIKNQNVIIPKLLIGIKKPSNNQNIQYEQYDLIEKQINSFATSNNMRYVETRNDDELSDEIKTLLQSFIESLKILLHGFLRQFQNENDMYIPLDVIQACCLWFCGSSGTDIYTQESLYEKQVYESGDAECTQYYNDRFIFGRNDVEIDVSQTSPSQNDTTIERLNFAKFMDAATSALPILSVAKVFKKIKISKIKKKAVKKYRRQQDKWSVDNPYQRM